VGAGLIRLADRVNLPALAQLARAMHAEAPNLRDVPLDDALMIRTLGRLIDGGFALVAQAEEGALLGFLLVAVFDSPWTGRAVASELALYVIPEQRGRFLANRMLAAAEARARELGATEFHSGTTAGAATEAACVVYARAGFAEVGRCFRKVLDQGAVDRSV
jgi:GNAT superfamily N-acetyltransferase